MSATVRLSGVLKREGIEVWNAHDTGATESEALDAIIRHMNKDALRIDLLCSSGPVHWHDVHQCWMAWGNFTIASGGFEICPLSEAGMQRLSDAYAIHKGTEHFQLAKRSNDMEQSILKTLKDKGALYNESKRLESRKPFIAEGKRISARLEAIYKESK